MDADRKVDAEFAEKVLGWQRGKDGWTDPNSGSVYAEVPPFTASCVVFERGEHVWLCGIRIPAMDPLIRKLGARRGSILCRALMPEPEPPPKPKPPKISHRPITPAKPDEE
jgi:hypothetical protein